MGAQRVFERFERHEITEQMLVVAARFFSDHYGIWGQPHSNVQFAGTPGNRVKMSVNVLRQQILPEESRSSYARVTVDGILAGHAFACRWKYGHRQICWITQLVVHSSYRERHLATQLLLTLLNKEDDIFGIMSSHPAACKTLSRAFGGEYLGFLLI
ncbi:hypothetical protein AK830_g7984 [Neonectria ditissima]|uniref:N-acetyltransferase domain-containing protein n=1 Tax=Neonectria ditissima TaxID=78410 RepID=A0A0P7AYI4_9HYPO|nr:hypothetical protein AK830_g7984 [Neonectria ditissima]